MEPPLPTPQQRREWLQECLRTFTLIPANILLQAKKPKKPLELELEPCTCRAQADSVSDRDNCRSKCLNRMICTECFLDICRCGALCENRRFQNCLYAEFYPRPFPGKGWGLCALQAIRKGQFICEMTGEVFSLNSNEGTTRMLAYKQRPATYVMKLSEGLVLDATVKGNWGRLINHSCAPNALTEKWNVVGSTCIGIFAIRDIRPGQEITIDYNFDAFNTTLSRCLCGADECKGYLGLIPSSFTEQEWEEYLQELLCELCGVKYEDEDDLILLCDSCNKGYHLFCLRPPLSEVPKGEYFCPPCASKSLNLKEPKIRPSSRRSLDDRLEKAVARLPRASIERILKELTQIRGEGNICQLRLKVSKAGLHIFKSLSSRFQGMVTFYWNRSQAARATRDIFWEFLQFNIFGTLKQLDVIQQLVNLTRQAESSIQRDDGIRKAEVKFPAVFMRKAFGMRGDQFRLIEREAGVKLFFEQCHLSWQMFDVLTQTRLLLKGTEEGILKAHRLIVARVRILVVETLMLSPPRVRLLVNKLPDLFDETDIRVHRNQAFCMLEHPLYSMQFRHKSVILVGEPHKIARLKRQIYEIATDQVDYPNLFSHFVTSDCLRQKVWEYKIPIEKELPGLYLLVFENGPAKRLTLNLYGKKDLREKAIERLNQYFLSDFGVTVSDANRNCLTKQLRKHISLFSRAILFRQPAPEFWDIFLAYAGEDNFFGHFLAQEFCDDSRTLCKLLYSVGIKRAQRFLRMVVSRDAPGDVPDKEVWLQALRAVETAMWELKRIADENGFSGAFKNCIPQLKHSSSNCTEEDQREEEKEPSAISRRSRSASSSASGQQDSVHSNRSSTFRKKRLIRRLRPQNEADERERTFEAVYKRSPARSREQQATFLGKLAAAEHKRQRMERKELRWREWEQRQRTKYRVDQVVRGIGVGGRSLVDGALTV